MLISLCPHIHFNNGTGDAKKEYSLITNERKCIVLKQEYPNTNQIKTTICIHSRLRDQKPEYCSSYSPMLRLYLPHVRIIIRSAGFEITCKR